MGLFDWIGNNKDWLGPVVNLGLGAYQQGSKSGAAGDYANLLREAEQRNYDQQKAAYDAETAYQNQAYQASQANSAANAAASRENQRRALRAGKKGMKVQGKYYDDAQAMLQPWSDAAAGLLPKAAGVYGNTLSGIETLLAQMMQPDSLSKLNQSRSAYSIPMKIPDYLRGA